MLDSEMVCRTLREEKSREVNNKNRERFPCSYSIGRLAENDGTPFLPFRRPS